MEHVKLTMPNSEKLFAQAIKIVKTPENVERFLQFAQLWYEHKKNLASDLGYATEWMERFNNGWEYLNADDIRRGFLFTIDGKEQGIKRWAKELADYNNIPMGEALSEVRRKARDIKIQQMKGFNIRAPSKKKSSKKCNCICKSATKMIGKLPKIEGKNFL